jgi:hypothetical protein
VKNPDDQLALIVRANKRIVCRFSAREYRFRARPTSFTPYGYTEARTEAASVR